MTIQFPGIEASENCLIPDSYKQNSSDQSFEEKFKFEKARLGLLFSPFSQLESLFSSSLNLNFGSEKIENEFNSFLAAQSSKTELPQQTQNFKSSNTVQVFDSAPLQPFNRQLLQELLTKTNWLIPNLSSQPLFYQAFLEGKLQPKLDLQFLIDQIADQVKLVKEKGKTELSLTLKPEELGEILLTLTSRSGMVSIQINASPETKKLIESQREELERALKKAKVNLVKIEIKEAEKHA